MHSVVVYFKHIHDVYSYTYYSIPILSIPYLNCKIKLLLCTCITNEVYMAGAIFK